MLGISIHHGGGGGIALCYVMTLSREYLSTMVMVVGIALCYVMTLSRECWEYLSTMVVVLVVLHYVM